MEHYLLPGTYILRSSSLWKVVHDTESLAYVVHHGSRVYLSLPTVKPSLGHLGSFFFELGSLWVWH